MQNDLDEYHYFLTPGLVFLLVPQFEDFLKYLLDLMLYLLRLMLLLFRLCLIGLRSHLYLD